MKEKELRPLYEVQFMSEDGDWLRYHKYFDLDKALNKAHKLAKYNAVRTILHSRLIIHNEGPLNDCM